MNTPQQKRAQQSGFVAGTLVHTKDGLKPIQEIKVGDLVLSKPVLSKPEDGTGEPTYKPVLKTFVHEEKQIWMVRAQKSSEMFDKNGAVIDLDAHDEATSSVEFLATPNYPVWVVGMNLPKDRPDVIFYDQPHWKRVDELQQHEVAINAEGVMYRMTFVQPVYRFANPAAAELSDNTDYYWYEANYGKDYQQDYVHGDVRPDPDVTEEEYRGMGRIHDIAQYHQKGRHGTYVKDMSGNVDSINKLRTSDGEFIPYTTTVYNFEVADNHTYFINYAKLWVHDSNCNS